MRPTSPLLVNLVVSLCGGPACSPHGRDIAVTNLLAAKTPSQLLCANQLQSHGHKVEQRNQLQPASITSHILLLVTAVVEHLINMLDV